MSHSLLLFYSYGFAVKFIDDCFSLCSNPQWKIICLNSVWKYLWVWWAPLFSFPVSLCTDQDSSILLYFHLNLTRKSDLFLVCSTVIFPILYTIVYRIRTYLYLASFKCLIWELQQSHVKVDWARKKENDPQLLQFWGRTLELWNPCHFCHSRAISICTNQLTSLTCLS